MKPIHLKYPLGGGAHYLVLIVALFACNEHKIPALATVTSVEPELVEPNEVLRITGSGFVQGPAHVLLEGDFMPSGTEASIQKSVYLTANAVSENRVEIPVSSREMREFALEPTVFLGRVQVSFPSNDAMGPIRVEATSDPVKIEFRPAGLGIPLIAKRNRQANRFLSDLGIELADAKREQGLLIAHVRPQSPADRQGIVFGDRLLAVDGKALAKRSDLSGIQSRDIYQFELVSREGTLKDIEIAASVQPNLAPDEFFALVISSIALGLFLAFSAPTAKWYKRPTMKTGNPALQALGFGIVSIPLAMIPAVSILSKADYGATIVLSGINLFALATALLFLTQFSITQVWRFLAHGLPIPAMIIVAGACGSALGLSDIVASQQAVPWGWHAWSSPFALAAVLGSMVLIWPGVPEEDRKRRPFPTIVRWVVAVCAASMVTICCLGGWLVPGVPFASMAEHGGWLAAGCLIFFAKTWTVVVISRWFASVGVVERRTGRVRQNLLPKILVATIAPMLTLGWMWTDIALPYRIAGQVLAIAACVTLFTLLAAAIIRNARKSFG